MTAHRADSDRYDSSLLKRIAGFEKIVGQTYDQVVLAGHRYTDEKPAILDGTTVMNARLLDSETPLPQQIRVVGHLDMVRMSSQGFELILGDGSRARGVLIEGEMALLKPLLGHRVLVHGKAVYRPSAQLLRIDAVLVESNAGNSTLWSVIPPPRKRKIDKRQLLKPQGPKSGVSAFYGTWPGDETDEEWEEMVERLS